MQRSRRASLQTTVFLLLVLVGAIVAVTFGLSGIRAVRQSTNQVLEERLVLSQAAARDVDYHLSEALRQLEMSAGTQLLGLEGGPAARYLYNSQKQRLPVFPLFVSVLDGKGNVLWSEPEFPEFKGVNLSSHSYVATVLQGGDATVSEAIYGILPERPLIFLAAPVRDETGQVVGVVQAAVDPNRSNMGGWVQPLALGETGYGQIVDTNGIVLASTEPGHLLKKAEHGPQFAILISQGTSTVGRCHSCHEGAAKRQDVLAFAPLATTPWGVAIQQSEEEAFAPARWLQRQLFLLGSAALVAALLTAWLAARYIAGPVRRLVFASRRIASGDLNSPLVPSGPEELYSLTESFESMRTSLVAWHGQMARWQEELEQTVADRTKDLLSLVRASEALISSLDPETVLKSTVETAVNAFGADSGTLFLWDAGESSLVARAAVGYDERSLSQVRLKPGEGIAGKAFASGQALYSNDPAQAEAMLSGVSEGTRRSLLAARAGREIQAFLCVPLMFRDRTLGSLFLACLQRHVTFSPSHVELAQTFARLASALLENLRLLQEASEAEALRQADRLKTDFLSNISHELQTPLASLKASIDFLSLFSKDAQETQAMLIENAKRSAERLQRLVTDLIDVARLQNLQLKLNLDVLDLRQVVQLAAESFEPLVAEKAQNLEVLAPDGPVVVQGDQRRIEQVLNNLLMNAHQHTPEAGHITLTVQEEAEQAVVLVQDTGSGIDPEEKERLFERFYRGSRSGAPLGLGLGLAIARGLVELHGGRLWVESEPGRGSVFSFSLPRRINGEDTAH